MQKDWLQGPSQPSSSSAVRTCSASPGQPPERRRLPTELEQMVNLLDQRVTQVTQAETARIRLLSDQTQRLLEGLQAMRVAREIHEERRLKELRLVESNAHLDVGRAATDRRELEARVDELGSRALADALEDFRRDERRREQQRKEVTRELEDGTARLAGMLEEQRASRVEYGERVAESLEGQLRKVEEALVAEQRLRCDAEESMGRMVEDVRHKMSLEIQHERSQREAVQGKLLGLLEETCNRIEASFSTVSEASFSRVSPAERLAA